MKMSFSHRQDRVLGAALADALAGKDHSTFVARVTAALAAPLATEWDVLASWARMGIAASIVAALGTGLAIAATRSPAHVTATRAPVELVKPLAVPLAQDLILGAVSPHPGTLIVSAELL
jgi:hypothetical protein